MLSKTLILAAAATGLMAGAAFAQSTSATTSSNASASYQNNALTPPDQIQNSPFSPSTVNPMPTDNSLTPSAADVNNQTNVSASVTDITPSGASYTDQLVTNGPVPDTPANRAKFGKPDSRAGRMTRPAGN